MIVIQITLGFFAFWSAATFCRVGYTRARNLDWDADASARFMVEAAVATVVSLGFLGLLIK